MESSIKKPYSTIELKNKCFSKDLVISFSMSPKQKQHVLDSIETYKNLIKFKEGYQYLKPFERFQYNIQPSSFEDKDCYSFLLNIDYFDLLPDESGFYMKKMADLNHLVQLIKRDKNGILFKTFKKQFINNYSFLRDTIGILADKKIQSVFGKLNKDGTLDMKYIRYGQSWNKVILDIHKANITNFTYKSYQRTYHYPHLKLFNDTKENLESRPPSLNEWGVLKNNEVCNHPVIPSFKDICISVLKEMFLINRKVVLAKIQNLPKIILVDFINSCFEDEKPVGQEILMELYKVYMLSSNGIDYSLVDELFPLEKFIKSGIKREEWFRYSYCHSIIQDIFYPHYKDLFAINVYQTQYLFNKRSVPLELENQILFKSKVNKDDNSSGSSIVDKLTFINNFHKVTNNMFEDLSKLPKGIIFTGGIITYCLQSQVGKNEEAYSQSDIDVCYCGPYENRYDSISQFIETYFSNEKVTCENPERGNIYDDESGTYFRYQYSLTKLGNHITVSKHYPFRHVQININPYHSIEDQLMGVDIDASCFAFNGEDVFCLERGMHALNYKMNIASNHSYIVREDTQYQQRLIKYLDRGFNIFYISSKAIREMVNDNKFVPHKLKVGFSLLYSAKLSNEIYQELSNKNEINYGQPYGPEWNRDLYDLFVSETSDELYDGYGSEKAFRYLISSIEDEIYDYDSERYNFTNSGWEINFTSEEIVHQNQYSYDYTNSTIKECYYKTLNNTL